MQVEQMLPQHAERLAELQQLIFPTLSAGERLRAEQYHRHLEIFPEGQFVLTEGTKREAGDSPIALAATGVSNAHFVSPDRSATAGRIVIGMTTTMRTDFDLEHYQHTFSHTSGGGWLSKHQPDGEWLYGLDMAVHPAHRGRGGARLLYRARQLLVRRLGLKGQLTVGMMNGYGVRSKEISGAEYYAEWLDGRRQDPTLTPQRNIGFEPLGLIPDYLHDPACGNYGVLLRLDAGKEV